MCCFFVFFVLARVLITVGVGWPNHLAVFAVCISVSECVTIELVSVRHQHGHWLCYI